MALTPVWRLSRISLNTAHPAALARFFISAFGFTSRDACNGKAAGDRVTALALGPTQLDLVDVGSQARKMPDALPGWSPLFQHFAIVTSDIAAAYERLKEFKDWTPISTQGPERLPQRSGGVTAFKFRDPDGHPLELIAFPASRLPTQWRGVKSCQNCLGIDHSAISVADTARSVAFYSGLGFRVAHHSLNSGPEQARLDAIAQATVEVTSLTLPDQNVPHLELLAYRGEFSEDVETAKIDDVAATRLIFSGRKSASETALRTFGYAQDGDAAELSSRLIRDPDGHLLQFETSAST